MFNKSNRKKIFYTWGLILGFMQLQLLYVRPDFSNYQKWFYLISGLVILCSGIYGWWNIFKDSKNPKEEKNKNKNK